jgi:hypothetical protein
MFAVGDSVTSQNGDFSGRVMGTHTGAAFTYQSLPENLNIAVVAVLNDSSGEIRHFTRESLVPTEK